MKSAYRFLSAIFCSFILIACGGGGDISDTSGGGGGTTPPANVINVSLTSSVPAGEVITAATPATLTATVTDSNGARVGELVTFALDNASLGTFTPQIGTALTNSNGVATVTLATGDVEGAGTVTASIASGESATVGISMRGDGGQTGGGAQVSLALTDVDGNPISVISSVKPGKLVATVTGITKPKIVTFTSTLGEIPVASAITNNGIASVDIYAGSQLGATKVVATLDSGETGELPITIGATNVVMGSGDPFVANVAEVSIANLSAGGTATVSVTIQDDQGNAFTQPVTVNFSSTCASKNPQQAVLSTPVTAVNGVATSTYLAQGCVGDDPINVTANAGGLNLSATGSINVLPADVGSIVFESAAPENISLLGTGGDESSVVKFKVLDTNSNPVTNQRVNFSLNTDVGGVSLDPLWATTNNEGIVQTVVRTGTVATTVRVTGTIDGSNPVISSQSSKLVISTGLPDQDSFSLSAEILNAEGWDVDGTEVKVTARLADAFNNPVPDGTSVIFTTEGGVIQDSCNTTGGACTVTWTSQNPRPDGQVLAGRPPSTTFAAYGQSYGGRATITATAIGEESFPDTNGNGRFDAAEVNTFLNGRDNSGNPYDLNEAFVDYNEDGYFNPQQNEAGEQAGGDNEELIDFDTDGVFDLKDGVYNGVLCSEPAHAACADGTNTSKSINVRQSLVIVMSGSTAYSSPAVITDDASVAEANRQAGAIDINGKGLGSVSFVVSDLHNQQMPAGSILSCTASAGSIAGGAPYTWPSTNYNGGTAFTVSVKGEDQPNSGILSCKVTTPLGLETEVVNVGIRIL